MAARVDSNLRALYEQLSSEFLLGPYDEFVKRMQVPENRQALYQQASEVFDLGPYDEFERHILPELTGEPAPPPGKPLFTPDSVLQQLSFTTAPAESTVPLPDTPEERRAMAAKWQAKRQRQEQLKALEEQYPELKGKSALDIFGEQFLQGMTAGLFRPGIDFSKGLTPEQEEWLRVTNPAIYSLYKTNPQFVLQELQARSQAEQAAQEYARLKQPVVSAAAEFTGMMAPFAAMHRAMSFASLGDAFPTLQRIGRMAEQALKAGAPVREWGVEFIASKSPQLIENVVKGAAMGAGWAQLTREPGESDEDFARRRLHEMAVFGALDAGLGIFGSMIIPLLRAGTAKQAMKVIDQLPAEKQSAALEWMRTYGRIIEDPEYKKLVTAITQELGRVPKGELEAWTQTRTPEMFPARRVPEQARFEGAGPVVVDRTAPPPPTMPPPPAEATLQRPVAGELQRPAIPAEPPRLSKRTIAFKDDPTQTVQAGLMEYDMPILNTTEEALAWGFKLKGKPKRIDQVVEAIRDLQREAHLLAKEGRTQEAMQLNFQAQMLREALTTATGKYWHYNARGELVQSDIPEFLKGDIEEARKLVSTQKKQAVKSVESKKVPETPQDTRPEAEPTVTPAKGENAQATPESAANRAVIDEISKRKTQGEPIEQQRMAEMAKGEMEQTGKVKEVSGETKSTKMQVVDVPVQSIQRDVDAFQNRATEYSDESVQRIVDAAKKGEFRFEEFDPILLWEDPQTKQLFVLSGHSRAEAFSRLASEGLKDFEQIPAKIIRGIPKEEAMQIARRSNVLATRETPVERAMFYRKLRQEGKTKAEVEAEARKFEGRNAQTVLAYSYLNPKGKVVDALRRAGDDPDVMKFARWVGDARRLWPELSDIHEKELWDFLSDGQRRFNSWPEFREFMDRVMQEKLMTGLKADELLNLKRLRPLTRTELEFEQKIRDIEQELRQAKQALDRKRREYVQRGASADEIERALKKQQDEVIALEQELLRLKEQYNKHAGEVRRKQMSLFEVLENEEEALRQAGVSEETIRMAERGNSDALKRGVREANQAAQEAQKAVENRPSELRPFTPEEVQRYNRYSHYEVDINDEFEALARGVRKEVETELKAAGIDKIPETVQKQLDEYLKKAQEVYRAQMRSRELAPPPSVVGPAKYPTKRIPRAEKIYRTAIEAADEARERLFRAVRQATREKRFAEENAALAKVSEQAAFEQQLKPGDVVEARWTNSGLKLRGKAEVVKVNPRSIRIRLLEPVTAGGSTWPAGMEFPIPRFGAAKHTLNHRVAPYGQRKGGELLMAIMGGPDDFNARQAARAFLAKNKDKINADDAANLLNFARRLPDGKEGYQSFKRYLENKFGERFEVKTEQTTAKQFEELVKKGENREQYVKLQRKVRALARQANMDDLELHQLLERVTGKRSFKDLPVDELQKVVDAIEDRMRPMRDKYMEQKQAFIRQIDDPELRRDIEAIERRNRELQRKWQEKRKENPEWPIFAKADGKGKGLLSRMGSLFLDTRYAWENAEVNTGLPFRRLGLKMIEAAREIRVTADKKLESIFEGLDIKPRDVVGFKDAEDQIRRWIVSGGETPIDPKLLPVARRIKELLEAEQETIRRIRFERWLRGEAEAPPNAPIEVLEQGKRILLEEGEEAFNRWLKEQKWGTRKDYLPSLHRLNLELDEFGSNLMERSKGQFETRTGEYYNPRPLFRELRRYFMNIEAYKKLRPLKKELQQLLTEAGVDKSSTEFSEIQNWWRRLNGFSFTNTVADKLINRVRSWFWKGLLNNNAFIYARNLFQNPALLYQKLGLRAMLRHGWKLFLPNVKLTGDDAAAKALREYFDTYISELSGLERDFFFVENVVTKYKLTRDAKRLLEWLPSKYGVTDLFNRLKAFRIVYDNAKDLLEKYRAGKIGVRKLMRNTGGYNLTNMEQEELLSYLAKGDDEAFLRRLAEMVTNNTHFKYTRFEKSLAEQSNVGQHLLDTFTWWKGNIQNLWKGGVERVMEGARKGNWDEAYAGLRTLAGYFIAAEAANYAMEKLLGKGKASYGVLSFRYTPGGVALNTIIRGGSAVSDFIAVIWEKDEVLKKYAKARLSMNANQLLRLLPFVDFYLNMYEAVNDVKGVTVMKELRRLILQDARVRYKRAKRSSVEAWQHFLFGTNEQPEAARPRRRKRRVKARIKRLTIN